ncbi:MAG: hypothetical protein ABF296_11635 [Oceanococcaceae bacterium]
MAKKRDVIRMSCVNLEDMDRMAVTSAINTSASVLQVDVEWTPPPQADIHVVDVSRDEVLPPYPVTLRYTARRNGRAVDIYRPIHARIVMEALQKAIATVQSQRSEAAASAAANGRPRRYRGVIVTEEPARAPVHAADAAIPDSPAPAAKAQLTYRGVKRDI